MAKKADLWNSNAVELNLEFGPMLKAWYESARTFRKEEGSAIKAKALLPYAERCVPDVPHTEKGRSA
ncbi:hypothetical protein DPMN_034102 [Dreissena polymorpha]|uniref:Uncharacterized protein n=1 Tax=Dreissena polymorpha TaxID=45954 RepID=A0A9D4M6Z9_DREPO|nr:hypothetical protein DPMN_034102 [Dreissena polymorpha]